MSDARARLAKSRGNPAAATWREFRGPVALGLLLLVAWFSSFSRATPGPVPADAPETVFSSGRAMAHLNEIARAARPTGSPEHTRVREYLLQQFRDLGHDPEVQIATAFGFTTAATVRNILVRIAGTDPGGPAVLATAHYDSAGIAVGAADDGSGVVAILEAVRALGTGPQLNNDLIVLISDAEEIGLLGARAFADEHPWMSDVAVVLGIEMRGGGGPAAMFETGVNNGWIIEAFRDAAPRPWANSMSQEIYRRMRNSTDYAVYREKGIQGLNFAGLGNPSVYHQAYDTTENFSERTLQHQGSQILAMIRHLGNADLTSVEAPDVSYFTLPLIGLVIFGSIWNWIIILGALAIPVGMAIYLTFIVPLGAMNLQWPALAACLGALALVGTRRREGVSQGRWLLVVLAAVPVLLIATSVIEAIWLAMSLRLAPVIGLLIGTGLILLLPAIRILGEAGWWWAPGVGALACAVFLAVGIRTAEPAPDRPAPSTLLYALDKGEGRAYWVTDSRRDKTDPGIQWAMARVGEFDAPSFLRGFAKWIMRSRTAPAPAVDTPLPNVRLVEGSAVPDGRVRLSVDSGIGAEVITLLMAVDGPRLLAVNGRELPSEGWRLIEHWGVPDGSLDLEIGVADSQVTLSFTVAEHLFRPEEILGHDAFERPPNLAPNTRANSDIAMIKTPVTVNLLSGTVEIGHAAMTLEANIGEDAAAQPASDSVALGGMGWSSRVENGSTRSQADDPDRESTRPERVAGSVFRDCEECPKLIVVPAGSFEMGSPVSEEGRFDWEGPLHRVKIAKPFAIGVHELTHAEWEKCIDDGGCGGYRPDAARMGRGRRPVVNVSWNDVQLYLKWISEETGKLYRLPSETEWEYAARAGTSTPYFTGDTINTDQANFRGVGLGLFGRKNVFRGKTTRVGSFGPNEYGLHDVSGNVWEWVQDCWNEDYLGAPTNGIAWQAGDCDLRVIRGGSYGDRASEVRSAIRFRVDSNERTMALGFRIARSL